MPNTTNATPTPDDRDPLELLELELDASNQTSSYQTPSAPGIQTSHGPWPDRGLEQGPGPREPGNQFLANENNRLRLEVLALRAQLGVLQDRIVALRAQLAEWEGE